MSIPVIDVFAGPGGLNEGFSSLRDDDGSASFRTAASFEMDRLACETLKLRSVFRALRESAGATPRSYADLAAGHTTLADFRGLPEVGVAAKEAEAEVHQVELGEHTRDHSDELIQDRLNSAGGGEWVLIGGPPCQAYSLAGRSRRVSDPTFADDHKHVLYREYLHIIKKFEPAVFVMENVKGMLSSQHEGGPIFERIKADLEAPGGDLRYEIRSLVVNRDAKHLQPSDFVIHAEDYGVAQRRHRVILMGIRSDLLPVDPMVLTKTEHVSVRQAIGDLPAIRSRLSPLSEDSPGAWHEARLVSAALAQVKAPVPDDVPRLGASWLSYEASVKGPLDEWLVDSQLDGISLHEARRHMRSDLERYGYLSHMAARGEYPKVMNLPDYLLPNHRNASRSDAPFADRFRVQRWDAPSTTVVSHIAKDGHYYIHPDPMQMRSLTVREAARLQSFPDNYLFIGNRTQQYHQVGNAVPPLLARQIGEIVLAVLNSRREAKGSDSPAGVEGGS